MRAINISDLVNDIYAEDTIGDRVPLFGSTFRAILSLAQGCKESEDITKPSHITTSTSTPPKTTQKRSAEDATSEKDAKRTKVSSDVTDVPHTPPRPTVAPNPNYTGSTDSSGGSIESTDEELTKALIRSFLDDARGFLRLDFRVLDWTRSGVRTDLVIRDIGISLIMLIEEHIQRASD